MKAIARTAIIAWVIYSAPNTWASSPPSHPTTSRPVEQQLQSATKRQDFQTLEYWISQLNTETGEASQAADSNARTAHSRTATSLVYGIESQLDKLDLDDLDAADQQHLVSDIGRMTSLAHGYYDADAERWRKQQEDDRRHGEEQIKAMLHDRPQMAKVVSPGDSIWTWTVRQFAGQGVGSRVFWSDDTDGMAFASDSHLDYRRAYSDNMLYFHRPYEEPKGRIRLRKFSTDCSYDEQLRHADLLWDYAVFELNNIRNSAQFHKVYEDACTGKISRSEFIRRNASFEFDAVNRTAHFYRTMWLPHLRQMHVQLRQPWREINQPGTVTAWLDQFPKGSAYPHRFYGEYYDHTIIPFRKNAARFKQCIQQAERLGSQFDSEGHRVHPTQDPPTAIDNGKQ